MAHSSDVSVQNCLVWNTEKPLSDKPRQSQSFSFLGFDWHFSFTLNYNVAPPGYSYRLMLHGTDKKELNVGSISVDIAVFVKFHCSTVPQYIKVTTLEMVLLDHSDSQTNYRASTYGNWTVYCVFLSQSPIELHESLSKTMYLSNFSDLNLDSEQNSTKSRIFMRAKLAACAPYDYPSGLETLSSDFNKLLEQNNYTDAAIKCGDSTFVAHRSILSARSEVFAATFKNKMAENETGVIDITDIDEEVFDLLLKYVYSGKVPELNVPNASCLYVAADKYAMDNLKVECSKWMLANLSSGNCLDFLFLADTCSDQQFKDRLVTFAADILDLLEEQSWLKFSDEHPKLAISVLQTRAFSKKAKFPKE